MPSQPAPAQPADTDAFERALAQNGLVLAADERASVHSLATWLGDGVARLAALPAAAADVHAVPITTENPADLSILEAGRRLRNGTLTAISLLEAHLARIAERDPVYLAFYVVDAERARGAARRADADFAAGIDRGPLHGIPIALKDLIDVAGLPTTANSRGRVNAIAPANAAIVDRLVEGGAVILGKLATYEWATVGPAFDTLFPPAKNPWNLEHITGGSSSGCAAAVAGRMLRTSVGSDTGGSVRSPAAYCGIVGLKPTYGLLPKDGVLPLAPSMDHLGPLSATVAEAAMTLDVLAGRGTAPDGAASKLGQPIAGMRIGYARAWFAADPQASPAIVRALDDAASQLSLLGATVQPVELPDYDLFEAAGAAILHYEAFAYHKQALAAHPEDFGRKTYQTLASGLLLSEREYHEALSAARTLRATLDREIFAEFDVLLTACTLTTALPVAAFGKGAVWTPMRTIGFNITGHPVLAMPAGLDRGLPMGLQLVGRWSDEATICQVGHALEQAVATDTLLAPAPRRDD